MDVAQTCLRWRRQFHAEPRSLLEVIRTRPSVRSGAVGVPAARQPLLSVEPLTSAGSELNFFRLSILLSFHSDGAAVQLFARRIRAPRGAGDEGDSPARRADTARGWMPSNPPAER